MNRLPYPLILLATLALGALAPPAASAKVMPVAATVCGADRCTEVSRGPGRLPFELMIPAIDPPRASAPPAHIGRWYSVDLRFGPPAVRAEARGFRDRFPVAFLPGPGYIRSGGSHWVELTPAEIAAYAGIVEGLEPFAAAALPAPGDEIPSRPPAGAEGDSQPTTVPGADSSGAGWAAVVVGAGALLVVVAGGTAWALRGRFARRARHAR
jgi:hypothetical protein